MPKKKRKVMTEEVRQFLNKQTCGTDTQGAGDTSTTFERKLHNNTRGMTL